MENIDELKLNVSGEPKYRLRSGNLFVSPEGLHFLDYLDPVGQISSEIDASKLTAEEASYIENSLQSNEERFDNQVSTVESHVEVKSSKFLDIGCGGGLFLSKIKNIGGDSLGIELSDSRAQYATSRHNLKIFKEPIESAFWNDNYQEYFDVVTIWDVIEHVNYPLLTLNSACNVLRKNGLIFLDTPCRDSFYHRFGELSYKISGGKFPTFLNTMYSSHLFGHKQIFSTSEMEAMLKDIGLDVVSIKKFHELSFPYSYYLKKMLKLDLLVNLALPITKIFLFIFPVKNKMLVIARKK